MNSDWICNMHGETYYRGKLNLFKANEKGGCMIKKKKINFSLIYKEIHNGAVAKSFMNNGLLISSYIRKPFLIYDFSTVPFWISLNTRKIFFSFLSVWSIECCEVRGYVLVLRVLCLRLSYVYFNKSSSVRTVRKEGVCRKNKENAATCKQRQQSPSLGQWKLLYRTQ